MAQGMAVFWRTTLTMASKSVVISLLTPVTPRLEDDVEEAFRLPGNPGDTVLGSGGDEGDQIHPIPAAKGEKFLLLLKGHVRQDQPVDANIPAGADKPL